MPRAIPGCDVRFARTKLHHIRWWRHGGFTDLDNLTPICVRHHSLIHTGDIVLQVDTNGALIVTTSEGTMTTGPPKHNVA
jgi:HNH endonuclease